MRPIFSAMLAAALIAPGLASAQALPDLSALDLSSFSISVNPQNPAPLSTATLSFYSGSIRLSGATLSLSVNGKNVYQGAVQPVSITLGRAGSVTEVDAVVTTDAGARYASSLSIQPQEVTLIAEPIASAPPLYPGKPSVPIGGSVRVVAIANVRSASGVAANPSTLSYSWTVDDAGFANLSGIGKSTIMVASPLQYRNRTVSVSVRSADGSLSGSASIQLSPSEPSMRIYRTDPLLGILFNQALSSSYDVGSTEVTLYAAPFSFPTLRGTPTLQWFLNGETAQNGNLITLRPAGGGQGSASLSLTASSGTAASATSFLSLSFGEKKGINFFGL